MKDGRGAFWGGRVKEEYRIAIVGAGKIASDRHIPALARSSRFELVAVVDPQPVDQAVTRFATIEEMRVADPHIDAVVVATPPQVRDRLALQALRAGYNVMLEKPPSVTSRGARRLVAECQEGRTLFAAWHSREAAMVERAADWLKGRIITSGHISWREDAHVWHPGQTWLWKPGGFGVFDPAINALSILTAIAPEPFVVEKAVFQVPVNQHAPVAAEVELLCGEAPISMDLDFRADRESCWTIALTTSDGGSLELSQGGQAIATDGGLPEVGTNTEYDGLYRRFAALIDAGACDVDVTPLDLVADAFLVARHVPVPEFQP